MGRRHTVDDYITMKSLTGIDACESAGLVSVISNSITHAKGKVRDSALIVLDAASGREIHRIRVPDFEIITAALNSNGTKIAYISSDNKKSHLTIRTIASELEEILLMDGAAYAIEWMEDGSLLILMSDPVSREVREREEIGDDPTDYEADGRFRSLYHYVPGAGFRKITNNLQVWEFTHASAFIIAVASDSPTEGSWYRSRLYHIDLSSGKSEVLYDPKWRAIARPRISPDSERVVFLESLMSDFGVFSGDIIEYNLSSKKSRNLTEKSDRSYFDMRWSGDSLLILWGKECLAGIEKLEGNDVTELWKTEGTVMNSWSPEFRPFNGRLLFLFQDVNNPTELCLADEKGTLSRITHENGKVTECDPLPAEVVKWKSSDGMEIYGIFRSAGENSPVVVNVHGGPTSFSPLTFMDRSTHLISSGFSVFLPNYRGSVGKGREYAEANRGDMGGMDLSDILTGMDYLLQSGRTKTDKWFLTGGSYGGFMTSWAITQTNRFSAAVGLFGIADWVSFHGTTHIADWDPIHYNESPYAGKKYQKFSALNFVDQIQTPVLLLHGIDDPYVPLGQYLQFYRALKDSGKVVRLLMFPREGHGFSETEHVKREMNETFDWFRSHS